MTNEQRDKILNPTTGATYEVFPPILIEGKKHIVGVSVNYDKKEVTLSHHTREPDTNNENDGYKSVVFDLRFLKWLAPRLTHLNARLLKDGD